MTSRERVVAALSHREPDRTPYFEYVLGSSVSSAILGRKALEYASDRMQWIDHAGRAGWRHALEEYVLFRLDIAERLGHDMLYVCPNPTPEDLEMQSEHDQEKPRDGSFLEGDPVERLRLRNEAARERGFRITEESLVVYTLLLEEMSRRGLDLPILAPAYRHGIWTDSDLMQTMAIAPEVARDHFSLATESAISLIRAYEQLGIDQIGIGGDIAGKRPLISPSMYRDFIMPEVRTCARAIHESGAWAVNASDGDLWSLIDDFLDGCEVDGYLEIDMFAGMDMGRLKASYGDTVTLFGNMDCGNILTFYRPDEITKITIGILEEGAGEGGHIFCASNAITNDVPLENYLAMVNAYRGVFGLTHI